MADTKISALPDGVTANGTDVIPAARAGANVGLLISYIATYFLGLTNTFIQNLSIATGKSLIIQSAFALFGPSDGVMVLSNTGFSGFTRLNFGGSTAASGAIGSPAVSGGWGITFPSAADTNGQAIGIKTLTELTTIASAVSTDTAILMPANAIILGVSVRVTVALNITTNFTVGDSGSAARFSTAAVSKVLNSTDPGTKAGAYYNASATAVRITPNSTPGDTNGRVRVSIHYIEVTVPTS